MTAYILYAANLVAILALVFGAYFPRHRRRDLVVAYLGVNIGVMAVAAALHGSAATAGLGLGLFGVLSIIRLRSTELAQHEVAYYFSALALGLLGGLGIGSLTLEVTLMALIVAVMWVADHPRVFPRYRRQVMVLDRAYDTENAARPHLAALLGASIHGVNIVKVDRVNDSTTLEVRYELPRGGRTTWRGEGTAPSAASVPLPRPSSASTSETIPAAVAPAGVS